jgi:hypothetical protein
VVADDEKQARCEEVDATNATKEALPSEKQLPAPHIMKLRREKNKLVSRMSGDDDKTRR